MASDYIPRPDEAFSSWFDNLVRQVGLHTSGSPPDWTHIPADDVTGLMEAHGRWQLAVQEAHDVPTPANIHEKNRVRDAAKTDVIRPFVRDYLQCRQVTDKQREDAGVPNHGKKSGSVSDPTDHVEVEFVLDPESHMIIVKFRIPGAARWGKGRYHCVEFRFWILPADAPAPADADAPGWQSDEDTASPWEITCSGADAGKRLWVAARWVNRSTGTKNQKRGKGPWSAIQSVIIP